MTKLETAAMMMLEVFNTYTSAEGNKNTLTKAEAKSLLEKELPGIMEGAKGKDDSDKLLKDLDEDDDFLVDFEQFVARVISLLMKADGKLVAAAN